MKIGVYCALRAIFIVLLFLTADGISAQNRIGKSLHQYKAPGLKSEIKETVANSITSAVVTPLPSKPFSGNSVTVIGLGTSANGLGWGYAGGQRTHLWADDNLKTVALIHLMGPATNPPNLSGYLAVDKAVNMGQTPADWTVNWQVYASNRFSGGIWQDQARFPQLGIVNPTGNTSAGNSYISYFAPVIDGTNWKNYTYGRVNWDTQSDSTKHLTNFNPPPYHHIPDGFFISQTNVAYTVDLDFDAATGTYNNQLIVGVGTWNITSHDFQYTYSALPLIGNLETIPLTPRIAASPDGNDVWIACIGNNGDGYPMFDSTYYPIFFHSDDAGQTWGAPIAVTLDGWNGLPAVTNFISDYRLEMVFPGQIPPRDQIAYSTAFDCDLVVDKWRNPHIGVGIHLAGSPGFSVVTGDSLFAIFHIYTYNRGTTWCARAVGFPKKFRGFFPASQGISEDNRVNVAINKTGNHFFFTWLDSPNQPDTTNIQPDIFARGFDANTCKYTNYAGLDQGSNVTGNSPISGAAWFGDASYYVFSYSDTSFVIPIATETISQGNIVNNPVSFNYIPDFSFPSNSFTIYEGGPPWGDNCWIYCYDGIKEKSHTDYRLSLIVTPNPARNTVNFLMNLPETGNFRIDIYSLLGENVLCRELTEGEPGQHSVTLEISNLSPGIYFYTVTQGSQRACGKLLVE